MLHETRGRESWDQFPQVQGTTVTNNPFFRQLFCLGNNLLLTVGQSQNEKMLKLFAICQRKWAKKNCRRKIIRETRGKVGLINGRRHDKNQDVDFVMHADEKIQHNHDHTLVNELLFHGLGLVIKKKKKHILKTDRYVCFTKFY